MNNRYIIVIIAGFIAITLLGVVIHPNIYESATDMSSTTTDHPSSGSSASTASIPEYVNVKSAGPTTVIPADGITPVGYYKITGTSYMQPIPFGYKVSDKDEFGNGVLTSMSASSITASYQNNIATATNPTLDSAPITPEKYKAPYTDKNGVYHDDSVYHNDPTNVLDNTISPPIRYLSGDANKPFPIKFVPNYEDSVYLSRTSGYSQVGPYVNVDTNSKGFCAQSAGNVDDIDKNCNALGTSNCASTTCCVLLGNKCVAGNEQGPLSNANYIDPFLKNKDSYYYQGKCYGNCDVPTVKVLPPAYLSQATPSSRW